MLVDYVTVHAMHMTQRIEIGPIGMDIFFRIIHFGQVNDLRKKIRQTVIFDSFRSHRSQHTITGFNDTFMVDHIRQAIQMGKYRI